jgi:hypothetical protein
MFGTRYLNLHEEFTFEINTAGVTAFQVFETRNELVVAQIGWMLQGEMGRRFSVRWDGRAGGGANVVERDTVINLPVALDQSEEDADGAFIGDTSLVLNYQVCCCASIYAGYYLLWVDGLALAPQQFDVALTDIDHDGFVFFQGAMAGAEVVW